MRHILVFAVTLLVVGCGNTATDAKGIAEGLAKNIDGATVVEVTTNDDPQGVFAGDNPPESMAVIHLPGSTCYLENAPCGAAVIVHKGDAEYVRKVAGYAQAMAIDSGTGYVYQVRGLTELIIDGKQDEIVKARLTADFDGDSPLATAD